MAKSVQDIPRDRQREEFTGREPQLASFHENLAYPPQDPRRRFVINVFRQRDVGKTWLLRRVRVPAE